MNRDAMEKWVGALENGDHKQCFGQLYIADLLGVRLCALGVGYKVAAQELGIENWFKDHEFGTKFLDWLGLASWSELVFTDHRGHFSTVTGLNDFDKLKFPEIAQLLRKEYL